MNKQAGIDIIVPVYNALADLKLCIESILRHTDLTVNRVVLIDDKSTDPEIYPYLKGIEGPGIVVLQNEQNQGFSGTINRGLMYSDRDVILLNTDTIVTKRWIEKITVCAYSDPAIGTVTPFSNNATLCSIPNFCQENTIPYGLSIDEYAQVIDRCSLRQYPRITVAVGFCMFIKREVIHQVGLFDQETFKRGYGEENDFCWRAEQFGYHHVLCDDTYIYHSGSASFLSEEKKQLIAEHEQIIDQRYPRQNHENAEYVRDNPHQYLRTNVDIHAKLRNGKRNILYVLHTDFRTDANDSIGGTQFHVKDLTVNLRQDNNVFVLARDGEILRLTAYLENEQITFKFYIGKGKLFQAFYCKEIAKVYREILIAFSIDLVHVHHVMNLSFDIFETAKDLGIPVFLTMHDFYYICPTVKLLENGTTYCAGHGTNCTECLRKQLGYAQQVSYLDAWREKCRQALGMCTALIVPSEAVRNVYSDIYPETADRIHVISHGMDVLLDPLTAFCNKASQGFAYYIDHAFDHDYTISGWAFQDGVNSRESEIFVRIEDTDGKCGEYQALTVNRPDVAADQGSNQYLYCGFAIQIPDGYFTSGKLYLQLIIKNNGEEFCSEVITIEDYEKREKVRKRIAFLGGLNETKGSQAAYQMIKQSGDRYDWYVIGGIGDPDIITLERRNVHKLGWYKRENVTAILQQNQIDLVCILPTCPETFCYTLSEAELAGIPVLAADIGALGERIRRDGTGWLIPPNVSGKDVLKKIEDLFSDPGRFQAVADHTAHFRHKSIGDMCQDYVRLYSGIPTSAENLTQFDAQTIYNAYVMGQTDQSAFVFGADVDLIRRVNELEVSLQTINQSLEYKMVKFFNRENFPFKRQFKWLIGVAYKIYKRFKR